MQQLLEGRACTSSWMKADLQMPLSDCCQLLPTQLSASTQDARHTHASTNYRVYPLRTCRITCSRSRAPRSKWRVAIACSPPTLTPATKGHPRRLLPVTAPP